MRLLPGARAFRHPNYCSSLLLLLLLLGKGQKVTKGLIEFGKFPLHNFHPTGTAGNTILLLIGNFQFGNVLHNGTNETIGTPLSIFFECRIDGVE